MVVTPIDFGKSVHKWMTGGVFRFFGNLHIFMNIHESYMPFPEMIPANLR